MCFDVSYEVNRLGYVVMIFIVIIIFIILFIPVYINITLQRKNNNDNIQFEYYILKGLIKREVEIPFIDIISKNGKLSYELEEKVKEGKQNNISENKHIVSFSRVLGKIQNILEYKKIKIKRIEWVTMIGFENAAITAILTGGIWAIKNSIFGLLLSIYGKEVNDYKLNVIPKFNNDVFETYFNCIIRLKVVYIIIAGLKRIKSKNKRRCK